MYNIIIENNVETLFRADSRSPNEIKSAGGFSMSSSMSNAGTLGKHENGRVIEPIIYTAQSFRGMRSFAEKMPGEKYYYQIDSRGFPVARYEKNFATLSARRNLTLHLKGQPDLMDKIIGPDWKQQSDQELGKILMGGISGEQSWRDLTTDAEECHIIGSANQLHPLHLFHTNGPFPIIVPLNKITFVGTKSKGKNSLPEPLS